MNERSCKACGNTESLVRHHLTYKPERIINLCQLCHNFLHTFVNGRDEDNEYFTREFIRGNFNKLKKKKKPKKKMSVRQLRKRYEETGETTLVE